MPEGHTLARLAREHVSLLRGRTVRASSPQGRFADGASRLDGQTLEQVDAYGKHLWHGYSGGLWLHVHLGLYGTWVSGAQPAPEPRGALRLRLETEEVWADLRGPTACALVTPAEKAALEARLGPDPLARSGRRADPGPFVARLTRSRAPVGQLLMDQSVIAGVGNVYRAEVLFRAGIDPHRPGRDVSEAEACGLWEDLRVLLRDGVRRGHIVTTRPEHREHRRTPPPEEWRYVYRRTGLPCRLCGAEVRAEEMAGRTVYWCPQDQPR